MYEDKWNNIMQKAVASASVFAIMTLSAAADWQFTKWTDTLDTVLAYKVDGMGRTTKIGEERFSIKGVGRALATSNYSFSGMTATASYLFDKDRLSGVNIAFQSPDDADKGLKLLRSQYDPPVREKETVVRGCVSKLYDWRDQQRGNAISYNFWRCGDGPIDSNALFTPLTVASDSGL